MIDFQCIESVMIMKKFFHYIPEIILNAAIAAP